MLNQSNGKYKILRLMDIMLCHTDEKHPITVKEIIDQLAAYGISAERKSIYTDLQVLVDYGVDIVSASHGKYYVASREFELPELKLLVDAVSASRFIPTAKSRLLQKKLEKLTNQYDGKQLQRQVLVTRRAKAKNEDIYYTIDKIYNCIDRDLQIQFQYMDYSMSKEQFLRHEGSVYEVSPAYLLWDSENYYMIAYDTLHREIRHYRVDRMCNAVESVKRRVGEEVRNQIDPVTYSKRTFGMYAGEQETLTIVGSQNMAGVIIDRFGTDIYMHPQEGGESFLARVDVEVSSQFFGWFTGLGNQVQITSPPQVVQQYRQFLLEVMEKYEV